jgi:2-polyprenyl-6-methoxyphenol hydroxylase-like FAD-dependent oxidoreductase
MLENNENQTKIIAVIGAGLSGSLAAIYFAKRGFQVNVYEMKSGNEIYFLPLESNVYISRL